MKCDVVVAGASVSGLLCAREMAKQGCSVVVIEEDYEVGTPEHCGGLVSLTALEKLGVVPSCRIFEHMIEEAKIIAPNGNSFTINSSKQKVAEINRREFDKQLAYQVQKNGAKILVRTSLQQVTKDGVKTNKGEICCKLVVDARGISSLINKKKEGLLQSAQYEILADWIKKGKIEVNLDQEKYPGFFAWIIPTHDGRGKAGVAGKGINAANALEKFIEGKGNYSIIRKIFAPIWIDGTIKEFVSDNVVTVGDAAGQSKPTTAGGIYSCGMGGILAGRAIAKYLKTGKKDDLKTYQEEWVKIFGKEFERQIFARKILEKIDNDTINKLFAEITPEIIQDVSSNDDFDFHTTSIVKLLGVKRSVKTAQLLLGSGLKKLLT